MPPRAATPRPIVDAEAVAVGRRGAVVLTVDGELRDIGLGAARDRVRASAALVCHRVAVARRLEIQPFPALDLLGPDVEKRPEQADFAAGVSPASGADRAGWLGPPIRCPRRARVHVG